MMSIPSVHCSTFSLVLWGRARATSISAATTHNMISGNRRINVSGVLWSSLFTSATGSFWLRKNLVTQRTPNINGTAGNSHNHNGSTHVNDMNVDGMNQSIVYH